MELNDILRQAAIEAHRVTSDPAYQKRCRTNRALYDLSQLAGCLLLGIVLMFAIGIFQGYFPTTLGLYLLIVPTILLGGFCLYVKIRLGI